MPITVCEICRKVYRKKSVAGYSVEDIMETEDDFQAKVKILFNIRATICSKECMKVLENTLKNEERHCFGCNKRLKNPYEERTFLDFKNKVVRVICEKCYQEKCACIFKVI